ncbi:hypothetical protein FHY64_17655 [Pelagovum pacificum]|uniref:Prepilin type IV endopeptidase peptidase domain-containing protein n=2 Tax=Pelagovum pacificum TaxID=2588711 RepID=A0A5C5GAS6_9RHOB|nr:hypothetical protein I8N54_12580 [Pelagovum pacificum]TNY31072.1 hypothetical protein FHY64_17655 [Pelagovum pacificum]
MKITNKAVLALLLIFILGGAILFPLDLYLWRWLHLIVVLAAVLALYVGGLFGGGDAKFLAVAAPYVAIADLSSIMILLAGIMLAAFAVHRLAKHSRLRQLAPEWESWTSGNRFPMGFPFGATLAAYLVISALS